MRSTRCRALALAFLLAGSAAVADPPADAPLRAVPVHKGDLAPADGVFLPTAKASEVAQRCYEAEHRQVQLPPAQYLLGAAIIGLVVGVVIGGVAVAVVKK